MSKKNNKNVKKIHVLKAAEKQREEEEKNKRRKEKKKMNEDKILNAQSTRLSNGTTIQKPSLFAQLDNAVAKLDGKSAPHKKNLITLQANIPPATAIL